MAEVTKETVDQIDREIRNVGQNVRALQDSTNRELSQMRALIDEQGGKTDSVVEERISKFAASVESKQLAVETGLKTVEAAVERVEAAMKRPGTGWASDESGKEAKAAFDFHKTVLAKRGQLTVGVPVDASAVDAEAYGAWRDAFATYLRRDEKGTPQAALSTGSDPDGGYLVPTETSSRIITRVFESSPLRMLATVETIGGKEMEIPRDEGEAACGWVGETASRPETDTPQVGLSKIVAHEMYAAPRSTQAMLEDAGLDIEAWLGRKVGDKFARTEATAFFTGDGVGKPRGLLTYANGTSGATIEQVVSGAATDFTFDGLKNLVFALKDPYAANASWLINRLGLRNISKLKDGEGRYLWEPNNQVGQPSLLLGYPVARAADVAAPGAGALAAAFGDFREAYTIVDRLGVSTLRDPFSAKPYVIFYTRRRVGGDVVNFEAVKLQVISA